MRILMTILGLTAGLIAATDNGIDARIGAAMTKVIEDKEVPGVVTLVATREGVTHFKAYGNVKPDSIFWIASMTKPITGTAILMLEEQGKLSVDDLVSKHIPELAKLTTPSGKPANVTIKQLMMHTSGMPEATTAEAATAKNLAALIPFYLNKPMQFEPGAKWQYCQSGINTLGRIIEVASGMPYEKFLDERLFKPLGMKDAAFYLKTKQLPRVVTPVKKEADGSFKETTVSVLYGKSPTSTDRYPAANGGLYCTASDYAKFARMILNQGSLNGKKYLTPESVKKLTTIQSGELVTGFTPGNGWGLTWGVVRQPQGVTAMLSPGTHGHGGAYGTQAWIDPVKGVVLVMMVQRSNFQNGDASPVRMAFQTAAMEN